MKTIIRNFLYFLCRFKMATILNVAGLSVAFAAILCYQNWRAANANPVDSIKSE